MPSPRYSLNSDDIRKWGYNLLLFTAPTLAVFFSLLANGVSVQKALPVAIYALYGALADLFKKWAGTNQY